MECKNCHCDLRFYGLPTKRNPLICGNCGEVYGKLIYKDTFSNKANSEKAV